MDPSLPSATTGYGLALLRSLASLVAVCLAAWATLRWLSRRASLRERSRHLSVVERASLDPRRSVYLVRAGTRTFLLGGSEQSVTLLAELRDEELPERPSPPPPRSFSDVLASLHGGPTADTPEGAPPSEPEAPPDPRS